MKYNLVSSTLLFPPRRNSGDAACIPPVSPVGHFPLTHPKVGNIGDHFNVKFISIVPGSLAPGVPGLTVYWENTGYEEF
jgi:hypothetical protein